MVCFRYIIVITLQEGCGGGGGVGDNDPTTTNQNEIHTLGFSAGFHEHI
jgi:hypothetical protein